MRKKEEDPSSRDGSPTKIPKSGKNKLRLPS